MRNIILLFISVFLASCSGSKTLSRSLNKHKAPLGYLYDSKMKECDKSIGIILEDFDKQILDSTTSVSKINSKVLPFIIYNYSEENMAVKLGQSSLEQNYTEFFKESFMVESQRSGCYSLSKTPDESLYSLEIVYDTCTINSKYQRNSTVLFLFLAYSMSFQEIGFPAKTDLALHIKLKKAGHAIFEKQYSVDRLQPFMNDQSLNVNALQSDFVVNMAESLSYCTKDCIEQIIIDINGAIKKQE